MFLCVVIDLYNKLVMGWSMHHRQDWHMGVRAVQAAVWQRKGGSEVILHSDHGGQFVSGTYQKFLGGNALVSSMSAVGHCADDAACESLFRAAQAGAGKPLSVPYTRRGAYRFVRLPRMVPQSENAS